MSLGEKLGKKSTKSLPKDGQPARIRLTWVNGSPKLNETRLLLAEAQTNKGILCELPIRSPLGTFILSCQSDHLSAEPCWTMYEGEDGSKQLWSYIEANVDIIHDIVSMSVLTKDAKTKVDLPPGTAARPQSPAPAPGATPDPPNPFAPSTPPAAAPATQTGSQSGGPWPPVGNPSSWTQVGNAQQSAGIGQPTTNPNGWTQPLTDASSWIQPVANPAGGWPSGLAAPREDAGIQAQAAGGFAQPAASSQPYGAPMPQADPFGAAQPAMPQQAMPQQASASPWLSGAGSGAASSSQGELTRFAESLDARKGVTIAELAMSPLLPAACVDAALKLQEMVLKGHFGEPVAMLALKYAALNKGELTDTEITRAKSQLSTNPMEAAKKAAALLQTAGMLAEKDIAEAEIRLDKHDNSLADALIATGKIDKLIFEAAQDCVPLLAADRLRPDQAIIALLYCQRSRAKLKDALEELSINT